MGNNLFLSDGLLIGTLLAAVLALNMSLLKLSKTKIHFKNYYVVINVIRTSSRNTINLTLG